jgi:peptidoglycan/xylan/chitin deacetylase (PgdA/CDA1 family)
MKWAKPEIEWLNQIIQERISDKITCVDVSDNTEQSQLLIRCEGKTLECDTSEFSSQFKLSELLPQFRNVTPLNAVFELIYACLTRQEEYGRAVLDKHDRFSASASFAHKHARLERPVVDECFEALMQAISRQWPHLELTKKTPKTTVTCDVDNPYEFYLLSLSALTKKLGGDLLKRKSLSEFRRTWLNYWRSAKQDYSFDPNNNFDWMMDVNEKAGNKMAFYFLVDQSVPAFDAHYSIDEPRIRQLMRRIYDRGHEIGLHASYGTYKNAEQMKKEANKLRQVMDEEGIKQDEIGSRQHFLRWSTPETARHLEAAGISYDTTLGYADHAGFRCGTSHEFPLFDIEKQRVLNIRERPLIMMEASVLNAKYMNKGYCDDTLAYMKDLKKRCHQYGGTFTMLWHNSHFLNEQDKLFYQELVRS